MDDWRASAQCRGMDSNLFFPQSGQMPITEAEEACKRCPVVDDCLEHALRYEDRGYWAGTTATERDRLREVLQIPLERRAYQVWPRDPCGTPGAAQRHMRAGEPMCEPCRLAWARFKTPEWKNRNGRWQ